MSVPHSSVAPCSVVLWLQPLPLCAFCPPSHAQQELLMSLQPLSPHHGEETVCALSGHQIPPGPLWSTGSEFREQPLVVPTQQHSFTKGLIKTSHHPLGLGFIVQAA